MTTTEVWKTIQPRLNEEIIKCLQLNFNFATMMPVQQAAIPLFLKHYDVAVEAQTGSGKTLSFLIPMFNNMLIKYKKIQETSNFLYGMIIVPTRELATQIAEVASIFTQHLKQKFVVQLCIGGYPLEKDIEKIKKNGCNILIGSPGKLKQLFQEGQFKRDIKISEFEYLIFDEADRLINAEYWGDIQVVLDSIPKQRRTGIFSATLNEAHTDFAKLGLRNPVKIQIKTDNNIQEEENNHKISMPKSLKNYYHIVADRSTKFSFLINYLQSRASENLKIILFFNTCATAEYYSHILKFTSLAEEFSMFCMHGKQKQKKRVSVYDKFKAAEDKNQILITTNVVARGIDFADVNLVVQFDPPQDPSYFVHRVGRTARSGREGEVQAIQQFLQKAVLLLEESEKKYVKFLSIKAIKMSPLEANVSEGTFESLSQVILEHVIQDRDLIEKGKQGFVSFIRSYKEHKLQLIFSLNELDIGKVAYSFFLLRLPRVKEILGKKIDFVQSEINPFEIDFVDKNKEKQFNEKKQKKNDKIDEKTALMEKPKKVNFHNQYMGKEINVKNNKSLRKYVKMNNDQNDFDDMEEELRLMKKLKRGKITSQQFKEKMRKFDPLELQSDVE